jgi:hypothetical protein
MSWYDGITDTFDSVVNAVEDRWDELTAEYTDRATETIKSAGTQLAADESAVPANKSRDAMKVSNTGQTGGGTNWSAVGVGIAALGLLLR